MRHLYTFWNIQQQLQALVIVQFKLGLSCSIVKENIMYIKVLATSLGWDQNMWKECEENFKDKSATSELHRECIIVGVFGI